MRIFEQITIVIIIVILVIVLDIITSKITKFCIENMEANIENISELLINENIDEANKKVKSIVKDWKKYEKKMNYYLEHNEIEKVSKQVILLKSQIEIKDINYAKQNIAELKFLLEHIEEKPKIKINNIF